MYKENTRILALIEDKAQKSAVVAGGFLAAAFAFLRRDALRDLTTLEGYRGIVLLLVATALFLACVLSSGAVLWTRKLRLPPDARRVARCCDLLLAQSMDSPTDEQRENHLRDQIKVWNKAVRIQTVVIRAKSRYLKRTQTFLVAAVSVVALLLVLLIFVKGSDHTAVPQNSLELLPITEENHGSVH